MYPHNISGRGARWLLLLCPLMLLCSAALGQRSRAASTASAPALSYAEYWLDSDPGRGNAIAVPVSGTDAPGITIPIDPTPLTQGVHSFGFRALDGNASWSMEHRALFLKPYAAAGVAPTQQPLNYAEYFLDTDPGRGNATAFPVSGNNTPGGTILVDPATLSSGVHQLVTRAQDAGGNWGLNSYYLFVKPFTAGASSPLADLEYAEYFLDVDPGRGNATPVAVSGTTAAGLLINIDPTSLNGGTHLFEFRVRNSAGHWSMEQRLLFVKPNLAILQPKPVISYLEYYIDNDPGRGNAQSVSITPDTTLAGLTIAANLQNLNSGSHLFLVRAKDAYGNWSLVDSLHFNLPAAFNQVITINNPLPATLCAGFPYTIGYSVTGTFNPSNHFIAQLSDTSGSFASPTIIGYATSGVSGTIQVFIPVNIKAGIHYRMRVVADDPLLNGQDNGQDLVVSRQPVITCPGIITVYATGNTCAAFVNFSASSIDPINYSMTPGSSFPVGTSVVTATAVNGCGQASCQITIKVLDSLPPVALCHDTTVLLDINGQGTLTPGMINHGSTDNCSFGSLSVSPNSFSGINVGDNPVTLTVIDGSGNSNSCAAHVIVISTLQVQVDATPTSCGLNNGQLTATPSGGMAPFTYSWSNGATTATISNLASGNYTVLVTDAQNISANGNGTVAASQAAPTPTISVNENARFCPGQMTTLTASGGSNYQWSTGAATASIQVSSGGSYTVANTSNGCMSDQTILLGMVNDTAQAVILASGATTFCSGNQVKLTATLAGQALQLNGNSQNAIIAQPVSGNFTIEYWMKTTQTGPSGNQWWNGTGIVDGKAAGTANDFGTALVNSRLAFGVGNPDVTIFSTSNVNDGNWHHIAATRDGSTGSLKLYIDGSLQSSATANTASLTASAQLAIGSLLTGGNNFNGEIDELRIWNTVRSASQIVNGYNHHIGAGSGLVAYYFFDESSSGIIGNSVDAGSGIFNGGAGVISGAPISSGGTYLWSNGASTQAVQVNSSNSYSVAITLPGGCTRNAGPETVNVLPAGAVDQPQNLVVCNGQAVAATIFTGGTLHTVYNWSNNNPFIGLGNFGSGDIGSFVATNSNSTVQVATITVTPVYDSAGISICPGVPRTFTITVKPTPVVTIQGGNGVYCQGQTATLVSSLADSYSWSNGAATQSTGVSTSGIYTVTVTTNGCTNSASKQIIFSSNHPPVLSYTGNSGFGNSLVNPASGLPTDNYNFEVRYTDVDGDLPAGNAVKLLLDFEGNGSATDPNDRSYFLLEKDPNDHNVTDGKDYYVLINSLAASSQWTTSISVTDVAGCSTVFGPFSGPSVQPKVNISIFANDITFSNQHPDTSSQLTVTAVIHNYSGRDAQGFVVHLRNQFDTTVQYPDIIVPMLSGSQGANSTQVSWTITTPHVPAWCPMQVVIDYANTLDETNELDNQAIRPFVNGQFSLPGDIMITAAPNPPVIQPASAISIYGAGHYRNTAVQLVDSSCAGATVTATILETGQVTSGFTDSYGNYNIGFYSGPVTPGTYHVKVHITDYTLNGDTTTQFQVVFTPCIAPDLRSDVQVGQSTIVPEYPAGNTVYIVQGESLTGTATVSNTGTAAAGVSGLQVTLPAGTPVPGPFATNALATGGNQVFILPSMQFNIVGLTFIQTLADGSNEVAEICNGEGNNSDYMNIVVLPPLPDIIPTPYGGGAVSACQWQPQPTFSLFNAGGAPTGIFNCRLTVYHNNVIETVINQSVANINPLWHRMISFNYAYNGTGTGNYKFVLDADMPDAVTEYVENNNNASINILVNACPVDLTVYGCGSINVTPTDPQAPGTITVTATVANVGQVNVPGPIAVDFNVSGTHYPFTIVSGLPAGSVFPVSVQIPMPAMGSNALTVTVDPANTVAEINEGNNSGAGILCFDFHPTNGGCYGQGTYTAQQQLPNLPVTLQTGLLNFDLYRASAVQVKFEMSGPGISGWIDLGFVSKAISNTCNCPLGVTLPTPFIFQQPGSYVMRITADFANQYEECDETNNQILVPITVASAADYVEHSEFIAPSLLNPDVDEAISIDVTYRNDGLPGADSVWLYTQVDNTPLDSLRVRPLATNTFNTVHIPATWSSSVRGVHVIRAVIDAHNEVAESNEINNEATRAVVVGQAPNLVYDSIVPNNPYPGSGVLISLHSSIHNAGPVACNATLQLFYLDVNNQEVLFAQQPIFVDSMGTLELDNPLQVTVPSTTIIGRIINGNPAEYNLNDNEAHTSLGRMILVLNSTPASCSNTDDGIARAKVIGGLPPYNFIWSNGETTDSIFAAPGMYTVTVSDALGNIRTDSIEIEAASGPCTVLKLIRVTPAALCEGGPVKVFYAASGPYDAQNQFVAELSDANGSFTNPVPLGNNNATGAAFINGFIPTGTPAGMHYRIRVVSTMPVLVSNDNGHDILIGVSPTAVIGYHPNSACNSGAAIPVQLTGSGGGIFSATPSGLSFDTSSGLVNPASSQPGIYVVTYTIAPSGACPAVYDTAKITITLPPAATIAYGNHPYCHSGSALPVLTGTTGGIYTAAPAGLVMNSSTGMIDLTASTPGLYMVTYTVAATAVCPGAVATANVAINPTPDVNQPANQLWVNGALVPALPFSGSVNGATFTWTNSLPSIGLPGTGAGTLPAFTAINAGNLPVVDTVTVTPHIGNGDFACAGAPKTFTIMVNPQTPTSISYRGIVLCPAGTAAPTIAGVQGGSFSALPVGLVINAATGVINLAASAAGTYTVTYSYTSFGSPGSTSTQVTVLASTPSVNPLANMAVCAGTVMSPVTFSGTPAGQSYTWTNSNTAIGLAANGSGSGLPGFIAANNTGAMIEGIIKVTPVVPANSGCTPVAMSFRIQVLPTPAMSSVGNQLVCAGTPVSAINFSSPVPGTLFSWSNSNTAIGLGAGGSGSIASFTAQNNTAYAQIAATITVTPSAGTCVGAPVTFTITVSKSANTLSYPQAAYCPVGTAYPALAGTGGGSYSATPVGLNINSSTGAVNLALSAAGIYTVSYAIPGIAGGCSGGASTILTVRALATAGSPGNPVYCTDVATAPISFGGNAVNFNWTVNGSIGLANGTGLSIPGFTTQNATNIPVSATITVTPLGDGINLCDGKAMSFKITVNPMPTITPVVSQTGLCRGVATQPVAFSGNGVAGTTYSWTNNYTPIGLGASGSGNIGSFAAQNPTSGPVTATITVTPKANKCNGLAINFSYGVLNCVAHAQPGGGQGTARISTKSYTIVVSPNPTQGWVSVTGAGSDPVTVTVLSADGQVLRKPATYSSSRCSIDLSGLPAGMYQLRISHAHDGKFEQRSIIKL
jgi:hypothetical protein